MAKKGLDAYQDDDFKEYIDFTEKYAESLCSVLRKEFAGQQWRVSSKQELTTTNVYNNEIACFLTEGETFVKGGYLIYRTAGTPTKYGYAQILSIQVNDVDYNNYTCNEQTSIGCKLDVRITGQYTFKNTR